MKQLDEHVATVQRLLRADVQLALRYLNSLTRYRFTGLYLFGPQTADAIYLVDRDAIAPDAGLLSIPLAATYCAFVRSGEDTFRFSDALLDERLDGHPSQAVVRAYWGAPIFSAFGDTVGSLCHFDFAAVELDEQLNELMDAVAPMFAEKLAGAPRWAPPAPDRRLGP